MGQLCTCTRAQEGSFYQNKNLMPFNNHLVSSNNFKHLDKHHHINNGYIANNSQHSVISTSTNYTSELSTRSKDGCNIHVEGYDEHEHEQYNGNCNALSTYDYNSNADSMEHFIANDENLLFNEIDHRELQMATEVEIFYKRQSEMITNLLQRVLDLLVDDLDPYYLQLYLFKSSSSSSNDRMNLINSLNNATCRNLLWDVLTGQENEDFELFCDVLSNDSYNKSIVELLMALECVVALVSSYPHHSFLSCSHKINVPHIEPSSFKVELVEDVSTGYVNSESCTTLKGNSSTLSLSSNLFNDYNDRLSLTNNKKSLPTLSLTFEKFCFCQTEQRNRFTQLVNEFSCINGLNFIDCFMDESLLKILSDGVKKTSNFLNKLCFQSCELNDQCLDIIKDISEKKSLKFLSFVCLNMPPPSLHNLLQNMSRNKYLTELNMCFVNITDTACAHLAGVLRFCAVKTLKLKSSGITSVGCCLLSQSIFKNAYLVHLDLSCNNLGNDGARGLSTALIHNRTLKELHLENCKINHLGMMYFARLLKANGSLKELILSSNLFGNDGIMALSDGLCYNHSMRTLQMDNCNIETPGFIQLLKALKHNRNLTTVKLCSNQIGKEGEDYIETIVFHIREVLHLNNNLKLFLRGNYISAT